MRANGIACILLACSLLLSLCGCTTASGNAAVEATTAAGAGPYEIPPMKDAVFSAEAAETEDGVRADFSSLAQGYVAVSAQAERRLKFQIRCGEAVYNYDLPADGSPTVFPLNLGDGEYTFRVLENVTDDKYTERFSRTFQVTLEDEFAPFLRPSLMVSYDEGSDSVRAARELAADCADDTAVVSAVYEYLVSHISYDHEKAETVQQGYLPDPDETLSTGMGICFDYAALAAAMLRSLGIPCKLITGFVEPDEIYHAWNSIYLEHQGWITVEIRASAEHWKRVDITFAASGVPPEETDDDSLYTTRYTY